MQLSRVLAGALPLALALAGPAAAEPVDLATCVRRALLANPKLLDAGDAEQAATLARSLALTDYRLQVVPTITGGLSGDNRTNQRYQMAFRRKLLETGASVELSGGTSVYSSVPQVTVPYLSETRLTLAQPLLQGRTTLENRERVDDAERKIAQATNTLRANREDLAFAVVRAFYEVVRAGELVTLTDGSIERVSGLADMAEARLSLGQVSRMDVVRAELNASRLANARLEQVSRRAAGIDDLRLLLGLDPDVPFEIDARLQGPVLEAVDSAALEADALERRAEVAEARARVEDGERRLLLARAKLWPALDLVGSYARQGLGESFEDSTSLDREEWTVGFRSTTPLDRTAEEVAISVAEIELRGRERDHRRVRADVVREVREAVRGLERARAERALAATIATQADEQVDLARYRYEKGVSDNLDLVQAELARAEARGGTVLGAIEEAVAAASIRRVTGHLVETFVEPRP